jgi:hypothetical protein
MRTAGHLTIFPIKMTNHPPLFRQPHFGTQSDTFLQKKMLGFNGLFEL